MRAGISSKQMRSSLTTWIRPFVIGVLFCMCFVFVSSGYSQEKILLYTDERPPFEYANADGNPAGAAVDIVACALNKMGLPYEIKITAWKRAQKETEWGKADGFFSASQNSARNQYAQLSEIVIDQYWSWYLLASNPMDTKSDTFKQDARTGSWFGSNSLKWLEKNGFNVKASPNTVDQLLKQLQHSRIDAAFGSNIVFDDTIEKMKMDGIFKSEKVIHKPMGVYISKKYLEQHSGFMEAFNSAVMACRQKH